MDLWFTEHYSEQGARLGFEVKKVLHSEETSFQRIDVIESTHFGRILLIDGLVMLTERDEFIYHEMIAHVPINVHPNPQRVLVIGAGDGGTLRELVKHPEIKHIDLVEIDKSVHDVSKKFFPTIASGYDDDRVQCHWQDGVRFVKEKNENYDLIIIDSTDPYGPGEGLFSSAFYQDCFNLLTNNGILVNQSESPQWTPQYVKGIHKKLSAIFPIFSFYQAFIPTYPSGHWLFGFASKNLHPIDDQKPNRWLEKKLNTSYYNIEIHKASFALPNFIHQLLEEDESN